MNISTIDPFILPSLPLLDRRNLPSCPAIYFVLAGERILYIGRSVKLVQRWRTHHRWQDLATLEFARVAWLECSDTTLLAEIEDVLIEHFNPELNRKRREDGVPLRLLVSEEFKTRLKAQAGRMGKTMGELAEFIASEPLRKLELETIQEQPATFKELIRQRYFDLMNSGKFGHQRLNELCFSHKPSAKERQLIGEILGLDKLPGD